METTTEPTLDELRERLAALEAENTRLQATVTTAAPTRRRFSWRAFGSAVCIIVATVLVPVSIVAGWARAELTDETRFVATFAPLARDAAVQSAVSDAAVTLIEEQIDIEQITDALFDGIEQLDLPTAATQAIDLLRAPAAHGLHSLLRTG